ncbi:MAG TPA: hypothetical protein IAA20_01820, partial [Candidatus Enterococcus avicola]|nr:hypothetical protein [Candidatus Enterococcus avicola]
MKTTSRLLLTAQYFHFNFHDKTSSKCVLRISEYSIHFAHLLTTASFVPSHLILLITKKSKLHYTSIT